MPDMIVNLLRLPEYDVNEQALRIGVNIHRALAPDMRFVCEWIRVHSTSAASSECSVCFSRIPVSCFVASRNGRILGYACYDSIAPDFFGPTAVGADFRGQGIGRMLLMRTLQAMREAGYVYAIIGGVGPTAFYEKCVRAALIPDSDPGIYANFLSAVTAAAKNG